MTLRKLLLGAAAAAMLAGCAYYPYDHGYGYRYNDDYGYYHPYTYPRYYSYDNGYYGRRYYGNYDDPRRGEWGG
jgi:hypothetical protein